MPYVARREGAVVGLYANRQPGYAEEWLADDDAEVLAFRNPSPAVLVPSIYAVANLDITPGEITGIETSVNFSAALYMDVGSYLLFFTETQANTNYLAKAYDDATRVRVTEKATDYIAVTVTDNSDNPVDPAEISVEIVRVS